MIVSRCGLLCVVIAFIFHRMLQYVSNQSLWNAYVAIVVLQIVSKVFCF